VRDLWAGVVARIRERGGKAVERALRLTGAATAAYLVAEQLFPGSRPLLAPLTALLVVQVTLYSTLTSSVQRVTSVVAGVFMALLFSDVFGFTWWSLAAMIAVSILIGQLLRLRDQLLEVPISAMLVLAVGGAGGPAAGRITETLVGAAVGVLYQILLPGPVQSRSAGEAVQSLASDMADQLSRMADEMGAGVSVDKAELWLEQTRRLAAQIPRVDRVLIEADESRKLNVRAIGTMDTAPSLRSGLDALEHCTVAFRGLCRAILDQARATEPGNEGRYSVEVREVFAVLLLDLSSAVRSFGRLVRAESEAAGTPDEAALTAALDTVREARVRLTELLMLDPPSDSVQWELQGTILTSVERVLREIDVEERTRQRARRLREWEERPPAAQAVDRLRATSRIVLHRPLRRRNGRSETDPHE
jgi:hypothetical protein